MGGGGGLFVADGFFFLISMKVADVLLIAESK